MLTLDLPVEPYWLALPRGVRVEIRPVTTAVVAAAQAASTRRVSVRLSLDDAARVKQELREVGETGQRSLARIQGGAERASPRGM